jgi:tRNA pseudouridine55 synthase
VCGSRIVSEAARLIAEPATEGGLVLVDKPVGPSSFAIVKRLRAAYGLKAGHAGTLDPLASGLLLVLLGRATRLAQYLVGLDKRYETEIRLGSRTTTGDPEGEELEETEVATREQIEALRGEVVLAVPAASAVKIDGERAYRLHRRGVAVEMPMRQSTIHSLEIVRYEPPSAVLALHVSSGTYVRAIADALGGHCVALRRTQVGPFPIDAASETRVLPPLTAVCFLPRRELDPEERRLIATGREIEGVGEGPVALTLGSELVAIGRSNGDEIRPETVLA